MDAPELIANAVALLVVLRGVRLAVWPDQMRKLTQRIAEWKHLNKLSPLYLLIGTAVFYYGTRGLSLAVKVGAFIGTVIMSGAFLLVFPQAYREFARGYFKQPDAMLRLQGLLASLIGILVLYSLAKGI